MALLENLSADDIGASVERDYVMISSIQMRNFRCFENIETKFKRFTFIVGKSGTGKTALLEALFLASGGNPEIYFRLRRWRGFSENIELTGTRDSYESVFRDLFYNFNQQAGIYIRTEDPDRGFRKLEISYEGGATLDLPLNATGTQAEDSFTVTPITFKWETPKGFKSAKVEVVENRFRMVGTKEVSPMVFVSPQTQNARQNAVKYSELSRKNDADRVLEALQGVFPDVEGMALEFSSGEPMLHVALRGLQEKLPLVLLSGGMNKYLSIILAILTARRGAVIVDEIENAFYYENLPLILRTIVKLCRETETQLIATTHSYEFLQSVADVMDEKLEDQSALLRLEQGNPSEPPQIRYIPGSSYRSAIASTFEVR